MPPQRQRSRSRARRGGHENAAEQQHQQQHQQQQQTTTRTATTTVAEHDWTSGFSGDCRRVVSPCTAALCPVCHGPFTQCVALVPCGHAFCKRCVLPWLDRAASCPTCRTRIPDEGCARWVRVRVVDELVECLERGFADEGAGLGGVASEDLSSWDGACSSCNQVLASEVCGSCSATLGLCHACATASVGQCEECEGWFCSSWCAARACSYCRVPHVCAGCRNSPLRTCPRPEC
ncbi:unnamed protein product [Polarella glacialis]|uniref:RING-type domain-containing protein n=1 Tax=Polarella glacialis TaxID=89957 RepID=A0A813GJ89_POLGL|nr:unnamed protein product [Polarella glacialis]